MKTFYRAIALYLALLLPASAQQIYPTKNWYWVVFDSSFTTTVWNGDTGAFVSNTDAAYETWLTAISISPFAQTLALASPIASITNNGNGHPRITLTNPIINGYGWSTGVVKTIFGTCSANATGSFVMTQVALNQLDLNTVTFDSACGAGGTIGAATTIDTAAHLNSFINSYVLTCYFQNNGSANTQSSSANIVLSNPAARLQVITLTTTGKNVQMPQANLFGSCFPIGWPVTIVNAGSNAFAVTDFGAMNTLISAVAPGEAWRLYPTALSNQQGTWEPLPPLPTAGVNCPSGVTAGTVTVVNGQVTHC